ncbi:MAG: hypothetical protein V2A54_06085, partial [Bacteroidota bacterium]
MRLLFTISFLFSYALSYAQVERTYTENVLSNPEQYAGTYTVSPFEGWQVSPSVNIQFTKGTISAQYYCASESPAEGAKPDFYVLKNSKISENKFQCNNFSGRFLTAHFKCSNGNEVEMDGLLVEGTTEDSSTTFYVKQLINAYASTTLTEPNRPADFYSPKNVLYEQYNATLPCSASFKNFEGTIPINGPGSTIPEFYKGAGTWAEGAEGPGIGEWLKFEFLQPMQPVKINIFAGYSKSKEIFLKNARIKKLKISASDKSSVIIDLKDVFKEQEFLLSLKNPV